MPKVNVLVLEKSVQLQRLKQRIGFDLFFLLIGCVNLQQWIVYLFDFQQFGFKKTCDPIPSLLFCVSIEPALHSDSIGQHTRKTPSGVVKFIGHDVSPP